MSPTSHLFGVENEWLLDPTVVVHDHESSGAFILFPVALDLEQSRMRDIFKHLNKDLNFLFEGEIKPEGGYEGWDGSNAYIGFVTLDSLRNAHTILGSITALEDLSMYTNEAGFEIANLDDELKHDLEVFFDSFVNYLGELVDQQLGMAIFYFN